MFTIHNFEDHISSTILQRGKQYYSSGHVTSMNQIDDCTWEAEVEGSETYKVQVTLKKNDQIKDHSCDCAFEGDTCKHTIAVFFALREEIKMTTGHQPGKATKKDVFEKLLKSVTVKEYQDFIRTYAVGNKEFKTEFELFFATKDERIDVEKKYGELVQKLIRKYSDRGYIDYRASNGLSREVDVLLQKGGEYADKNNFRDAFSLAKAVLKPLMGTIEYCDDSNGDIGDRIDNTISLLEAIASSATPAVDIKDQLLVYIKNELNNKLYFDYGDFGYNLFSVFQTLAVQLNKPDLFLGFVDAQLSGLKGEYEQYRKEYFQKSKISFLQQIGREAEASGLAQQSMHIVDVRMGEVNKKIKKKDFDAAKKLIAGGIEIAKNNAHPGTVNQWQKELLRIAVLENDRITVKHHTKYFAFDRGFSSEYYRQWKATFTATDWREEIERHIEKTIKDVTKDWDRKNTLWRAVHPPLLGSLASIFIEEKYWDRLLLLVQKEDNLDTIMQYHSCLVKKYPDELMAIYLPALKQSGIKSNSRSEYVKLVSVMKRIIKDIPLGKEKIQHLAKEMIAQFSSKPRRPAMIEEQGKIL